MTAEKKGHVLFEVIFTHRVSSSFWIISMGQGACPISMGQGAMSVDKNGKTHLR